MNPNTHPLIKDGKEEESCENVSRHNSVGGNEETSHIVCGDQNKKIPTCNCFLCCV